AVAGARRTPRAARPTRFASFDFYEVPHGIIKKRTYKNGVVDEHPLIFSNILRVSNSTQIRVPIDDTHTNIFFVRFVPNEYAGNGHANGSSTDEVVEVNYLEPFKTPADGLHPNMSMCVDLVVAQYHMAWETQRPIAEPNI